MKFAERVSEFMARYYYSSSQFGRAAMEDPNFVPRLLKGRQVTERVMDKVDAWMALGPAEHANLDRVLFALEDVPLFDTPPKAERVGNDPMGAVIWSRPVDATIVRMYGAGRTFREIGLAIGVSSVTVARRGKELGLDSMLP